MLFSVDTTSHPNAEAAWRATLEALIESGQGLAGERPSRELLGYDVLIGNPRRRLIGNSARPLPLTTAIARFVWMMAGNERVSDIAFYEPRVRKFSDDALAVPGSNYGARLRRPYAGVDQVQGAIDRLRDGDEATAGLDGKLRRAANVIWKPEDAVRTSSDIPCAFGLFYFPRNGELTCQLVMRSNNALALLPFNMFEFTLLAEVVAAEAGFELGPFRVDAMSMHLYEVEEERAQQILNAPQVDTPEMPAIQQQSNPLDQVNLLAQCEADLRHQLADLAREPIEAVRERGKDLDGYWRPFFDVLLAYGLTKTGRIEDAREIASELPSYFSSPVQVELQHATSPADDGSQSRLFPVSTSGVAVADALRGASVDTEHLHALLDEIEQSEGIRVSHRQADAVRKVLEEEIVDIAARSEADGDPEDFRGVNRNDVLAALSRLGIGR